MKCNLTFDAISGYFASFVFAFLITIGLSFFTDWKLWYLSLCASSAFLGIVYSVLLLVDKKPILIIDTSGIAFKSKWRLWAKPKFLPWASVMSFYDYTYPLDHNMQSEYLILVCVNGKKQKINITGLDHSKEEIIGAVRNVFRRDNEC